MIFGSKGGWGQKSLCVGNIEDSRVRTGWTVRLRNVAHHKKRLGMKSWRRSQHTGFYFLLLPYYPLPHNSSQTTLFFYVLVHVLWCGCSRLLVSSSFVLDQM